VNASYKCLSREPDAGNLHVRFDEGEGGYPHGCPLSTLLVPLVFNILSRFLNFKCCLGGKHAAACISLRDLLRFDNEE
jgi:hypothetical protein